HEKGEQRDMPEAVCGGGGSDRSPNQCCKREPRDPGRSRRVGVTSDEAEDAPRLRVTYGEDAKESAPPVERRAETHTASAQDSSSLVPWRWRSRRARIIGSHRPRRPPALAVPRYVRPSTERLRHLAPGVWASPVSHSTADARRGHRSDLLYFCHPRPVNESVLTSRAREAFPRSAEPATDHPRWLFRCSCGAPPPPLAHSNARPFPAGEAAHAFTPAWFVPGPAGRPRPLRAGAAGRGPAGVGPVPRAQPRRRLDREGPQPRLGEEAAEGAVEGAARQRL